jgi:hypothetical protein
VVSGTLALRAGSLVISTLTLTPNTGFEETGDGTRRPVDLMPDSGLTSAVLRSIRLTDIISAVQARLERNPTPTPHAHPPTNDPDPPPAPQGRRRLPDRHYQQLAMDYLELQAEAGVTRRLSQRWRRPEPTIKTWIGQATRLGFLGPGTKGRRLREPGPRLDRWATMHHPTRDDTPRVTLSALAYHQRQGWRLIPGTEETARPAQS